MTMKYEAYIEKLKEKFERHFHIETGVVILGESIDMHASFSNISGRTFITKYDVIDKYENYELCYIKGYNDLTFRDVAKFGDFLKKAVSEFVNPGADHMSTYVTGVMVADSISGDIRNVVEEFKYSMAYMFYLRGWCDVRLVCVDLSEGNIITNKAGKRVKKVYELAP